MIVWIIVRRLLLLHLEAPDECGAHLRHLTIPLDLCRTGQHKREAFILFFPPVFGVTCVWLSGVYAFAMFRINMKSRDLNQSGFPLTGTCINPFPEASVRKTKASKSFYVHINGLRFRRISSIIAVFEQRFPNKDLVKLAIAKYHYSNTNLYSKNYFWSGPVKKTKYSNQM